MNARELRIGNFIQTNGILWEVGTHDFGLVYKPYFEPIELNDEWLEKFGFIKYDQMGDWSFWNYKLPNERYWNIGMLSKGVHVSFGGLNWDDCPIVEYVHELQNLYFAITRNELILIK